MNQSVFEENYSILNDAQRKAVETIYGPIMVVAGPGTGKTQIIALRSANILKVTDVNPENILITTFTEAGVIAIKKRLQKFIWHEAHKVQVSTIHSLSQDIISSFPEKFIEERALNSIDEVEQLEILVHIFDTCCKDHSFEFLFSAFDNHYYLRDIRDRISKLKQEWVSLVKFKKLIEEQKIVNQESLDAIKPKKDGSLPKKHETEKIKWEKHIWKLQELAILFEAYNAHLRERGLYDYNDMINFVLEKMKWDDDLRYYYAEKFQFIMIDEYQDTNNAQNEIVDIILSTEIETTWENHWGNIMVVWDDDQSIYRFQWANVENMLNFVNKYPKTEFIVLENNYRSTQEILDISLDFISYNNERLTDKLDFLEKNLISSGKHKTGPTPHLSITPTALDEKMHVLEKIKEIQEQGAEETIAIIVRKNREVWDWSDFLQAQWLPVESKLKTNILTSDYIRFVLDYLSVIQNPHEANEKLINLCRTDLIDIENIDILQINRYLYNKNYTRTYKMNFIDIISDDIALKTLPLKDIDKVIAFRDTLLDITGFLARSSFVRFFNYFLQETGLLEYIETNWEFSDIEDIFTLFNKIKEFNKKDKEMTLASLLKKLNLYEKYGYSIQRQILKKQTSGIEIMTAHSSKGLEFKNVFIPGLFAGNWEGKSFADKLKLPEWVAWSGLQFAWLDPKEKKEIEKNKQAEEDRRLFFVAVTRAEQNLFMSFPSSTEDNKALLRSPFLDDIYKHLEVTEIPSVPGNQEAIKNLLLGNTFTSSSKEEFDYIQEFLENYKLSPSDLNKFIEDPKVFLHEAIFKYPFEWNEFTVFWSVYHRVLELYIGKKMNWEKPLKSYLTSTFTLLLKKEILTADEFERINKKGIGWLEWYYDISERDNKTALALEYNFRQRGITFEWIPLTWKIDKIERMGWVSTSSDTDSAEGSQMAFFKESVSLIDYKTGKVKTPGVIKWLDRYGNKKPGWEHGKYLRQLLFYKLLAELDREFSSKFSVEELAIDFVEWKDGKYKYVPVSYTPEEYEAFKTELKDAWNKIQDIDFWKELLK